MLEKRNFNFDGNLKFRDKGLSGLTVPKWPMGVDKSAKNTPNAPKFICPICLPIEQRLHWASVVRGLIKIVRSICIVLLRVNQRFRHMYCMDF